MASGFIFHGINGSGEPAEVAAEKALAAAVPFVAFAQTGGSNEKALPDHLASKASIGHTPVNDADYQCLAEDVQVGVMTLTLPRVVSLPDVDTYPPGQDLVIADESGACSEVLTITIQPGTGTGDIIGGPAGPTTIILTSSYQAARFRRGAANLWIRL